MFESFYKKNREQYLPNEVVPHFNELNSLGVEWRAELTRYGYKYTFSNAQELERKYYLLKSASENQVLFVSLHYNEDDEAGFLHLENHKKVKLSGNISYIKNKFPDIDNLILSACYPVYAKNFAGDLPKNVVLLGNNDREYRVMFYKKKGVIEVIPTKSQIDNPSK